ncbi:MAG TPA: SRPBCC family protein [Gemmatimonadales bacterium]|nr:SRPBCC family protein [Gemmatimonadales bacterium]
MSNPTTLERKSERELVITRSFDAPARIVFEAWTRPELIQRWWIPRSIGMTFDSCEMDARTGGSYRFVFSHPDFDQPMAFFGRYIEVTPHSRIVWTNEEGSEGAISTLTFEEVGGRTLQVLHELYPTVEALEESLASGAPGAAGEQYEMLDELLGAVQSA